MNTSSCWRTIHGYVLKSSMHVWKLSPNSFAYPYIRVSTYRTCTIKPIALYGCEIWGTFNSNTARFRNGTVSPDRIYSNLIGEKLHTKFCKFILGVHKKTTNFAVLSELGRFPLYYDIIKSIFHYWNRLEYLEKFPFTTKCLWTIKTTI